MINHVMQYAIIILSNPVSPVYYYKTQMPMSDEQCQIFTDNCQLQGIGVQCVLPEEVAAGFINRFKGGGGMEGRTKS